MPTPRAKPEPAKPEPKSGYQQAEERVAKANADFNLAAREVEAASTALTQAANAQRK